MSLLSQILGLPPVRSRRLRVQHDLEVPMRDGTIALADRYHPQDDERAPLVLIRGPYGRRSSGAVARIIAKRGYQVLIVSLRGTAGSGGRFEGWHLEPSDGPALMDWLRERDWFPGAFATWGASFLGYSQWGLAAEPIPEWKAAVISDAPSEARDTFLHRGGAFALKDWLGWAQQMQRLEAPRQPSQLRALWQMRGDARLVDQAVDMVPIGEADRAATGERIDFFQGWLEHPEPGEYWAAADQRANAANLPPVVLLTGGWRDIFLPGTLADDAAARTGGRTVRLLVGPWSHGREMFSKLYARSAFAVLDHALRGTGELPEPAVRLFVTGANRWREYAEWPPAGHAERAWFLRAGGGLTTQEPAVTSQPTAYRYDPADPTPPAGDPVLHARREAKDNRAFEARSDVVTFSSGALSADVEAVGPVRAEVYLRSDQPYADLVVRVCDVAPNGVSRTVCMGITRLGVGEAGERPAGPDGVRRVRVELWPIAHRFASGHRIRLHVCGGAHPVYHRNLGTGDQLGTEMLATEHEVLHDAEHPSAIHLTVQP